MVCQPATTVVEKSESLELHQKGTGIQETETLTTADAAESQAIHERKRNCAANLKTAAMLLVVTVVFVITFLPAFLMTLGLLPYNKIIFYMYFANNVANPIIYSFMNHNFRSKLKPMIFRR